LTKTYRRLWLKALALVSDENSLMTQVVNAK
jgi:hypothetical protein